MLAFVLFLVAGPKWEIKQSKNPDPLSLPFDVNREEQGWVEGNIFDNEHEPFIPSPSIEPIPIFIHVISSFWSILTTSSLQLTSMNIL